MSQYSTRKGKRMPAAPVPLKQKALAAPRLFSKYLKNIKATSSTKTFKAKGVSDERRDAP